MRLYEFVNTDSLVTKLVAVSDQLQSDLAEKRADTEMTVDQLLKYFQKYNITLDKLDLYNMIKKPPLKNLIDNIQGDHIVFKGFAGPEASPDKSENEKTVKAMAANAAKSLSK